MAFLIKRNGKKMIDHGPIYPRYVNAAMPGLSTKEHVELTWTNHILRIEIDKAEMLAKQILDICQRKA